MVSAFRGVIAPAADEETIAVVTPELTTGLNDVPKSLTGAPFGVSAFFMALQATSCDIRLWYVPEL